MPRETKKSGDFGLGENPLEVLGGSKYYNILRQIDRMIGDGATDKEILAKFADPQVVEFLLTVHFRLNDLTPLEALRGRSRVVQPKEVGDKTGRFEHYSFRREPPDIDLESERTIDYYEEKREKYSEIPVVCNRDDVNGLHPFTREVHISHQDGMKLDVIEAILKRCPQLSVIQFAKSYQARVGPTFRKLIKERNIKIRIDRIRDNEYYDQTRTHEEYLEKKKRFSEYLAEPNSRAFFEKMRRFELLEAEVALMYFGPKRVSIRELAEILGVRQLVVQRKLAVIMAWMGFSMDPMAIKRSKALPWRMMAWDRANTSREEKEKLRRHYAVAGQLPPERLRVERYELWQKLNRKILSQPDKLEELTRVDVRVVEALKLFFRLGEYENIEDASMESLGKKIGVTRARVAQLKEKGLEFFGVSEEEENSGVE